MTILCSTLTPLENVPHTMEDCLQSRAAQRFIAEGYFSLLFNAHFTLINSSGIPCNGAFTSDRIRKAEKAPEDRLALGVVKEQAYLRQVLLLEAGGTLTNQTAKVQRKHMKTCWNQGFGRKNMALSLSPTDFWRCCQQMLYTWYQMGQRQKKGGQLSDAPYLVLLTSLVPLGTLGNVSGGRAVLQDLLTPPV